MRHLTRRSERIALASPTKIRSMSLNEYTRPLRLCGAMLSLLLLAFASAGAQETYEVVANVTVSSNTLDPDLQDEVSGFAAELERYINQTQWYGDGWKGTPVDLTISVMFKSGSPDGIFEANLLVVSQRDIHQSPEGSPMMRIMDEKLSFRYARNQSLQQNPGIYDPITSPIDFYVYVALGLDLDTYGYLGGSDMYEKALQIARRGELETSAGRAAGWSTDDGAGAFSRQNLIKELTNTRFQPIRKFFLDYHYNGLDRLKEFPDVARDSMNIYINDLMRIKDNLVASSTLIRVINDTKHQEFAKVFRGYEDPTIWDRLLFIDPSHSTIYEEGKNGR